MSAATATTLVVPPEALAAEEWRIEREAYHHLFRVKRLGVGETLRLTDGAGRARFAEVTAISRSAALARLGEEASANEPDLEVELWVAPPKPERAAWLVEKATEIGVVAVRFVATERAARPLPAAQLERLRRVAAGAVEQCGRARVPELVVEAGIEALMARSPGGRGVILLDTAGTPPFPAEVASGRLAVAVGPEGGWSAGERDRLVRAGCATWSLGARVLRVETAAIVAAGFLLATGRGAVR